MGAYLAAGVLGLAVGRFLSGLIHAALQEAPLGGAMRRLPGCGCRAGLWDRLPLVWWIRNRGRCRRGGHTVDAVYPVVELLTGGLFAAAVFFVGLVWSLPAYLWFVSVTASLGFIDFRRRLIPNRILLPGTAAGIVLLAAGAVLDDRLGDLPEALSSGLGYFLVLLAMNVLARGAIGMGDVKLAFMLGVFAGYDRWETAVTAGIGAFALAGAASVLLLVFRLRSRTDFIPFGPFMVAAAWTAAAWSLASGTGLP